MRRHNLSNLTFIIPLRIDSIDRLENLLFATNYILKHFQTNVIVWEADERNTMLLQKLLNPEVKHIFHTDYDPIFYRTKHINTIVKTVDTPYIAIWDADVVVPKEQILASIKLLSQDKADFVYPYKDIMLNVPACVKNIYAKTEDISILEKYSSGFHSMYGPKALGGGFIVNRLKYIEAGMENENYYGWGLEDGERYHRWLRLNYKVVSTDGVLFHLDHSRGVNSIFHSNDQSYIKRKEQFRIRNMSLKSLQEEVKTWHTN